MFKRMRLFAFLSTVVLIFASLTASADSVVIEREIENLDGLEMVCKVNPDVNQIRGAREYMAAIDRAVGCSRVEEARELALGLAKFLQQAAVPKGTCYDDVRCRIANSNSLVTKGVCKAAGGKSWLQKTPTQGACERT